jgi:hypothetical protein
MTKGAFQFGTHLAAETWTLLYMMGVGRARVSSLPMPVTLRPGIYGSPHNLTCNPRWLEVMMGWPINWTDTDSPVTELCLWRRRMRWQLWQQMPVSEND